MWSYFSASKNRLIIPFSYSLAFILEDTKFNKDNLVFERLFDLNEYHQNYSVQTGGRIEKFKNDKILFSVGTFTNQEKAQDLKSSFGKILSVNKKNGDAKIISFGHRNPQGLAYIPEKNIILNSEHGPKECSPWRPAAHHCEAW